jgi:hypothetical protein
MPTENEMYNKKYCGLFSDKHFWLSGFYKGMIFKYNGKHWQIGANALWKIQVKLF